MRRKNTNKTTPPKTVKATVKSSPVKKVALKKDAQSVETFAEVAENAPLMPKTKRRKGFTPIVILALCVIVLGFLAYNFKDRFLVAIVDGKPIFRSELNQKLTASFGKETLENLIVERLVAQEARRQKVVVTEEEINAEVEKLAKSLGEGTKIEDVLAFQGISLQDFRNQLKLRLQANKILAKDITISEEEIDNFIKDNGSSLVATAEAEKRAEAKEALMDQKTGAKIQEWVSGLLAKAKITRYLK